MWPDVRRCKSRCSKRRSTSFVSAFSHALDHYHSRHVTHRDMKLHNLLIDVNCNVKIANFGWSNHATIQRRRTIWSVYMRYARVLASRGVIGTGHGHKLNVWKLGVLMDEFLIERALYEGKQGNCGQLPQESSRRHQNTPGAMATCQRTGPAHLPQACVSHKWIANRHRIGSRCTDRTTRGIMKRREHARDV